MAGGDDAETAFSASSWVASVASAPCATGFKTRGSSIFTVKDSKTEGRKALAEVFVWDSQLLRGSFLELDMLIWLHKKDSMQFPLCTQ